LGDLSQETHNLSANDRFSLKIVGKTPKLSATALAHIRAAQKARWTKWRKEKKSA
jgi:hypothetical protein